MPDLLQIFEPVRRHLRDFEGYYENLINKDNQVPKEYMEYLVRHQGKMIRPAIVFLIADSLGNITGRTHLAAALVEMMHNAALLHDDVIDKSMLRRGKPSFNSEWGDERAILVGDYLVSVVFDIAAEKGETDFLRILSKTFKNMSIGEIIQLDGMENRDMSEEIYMRIISHKTALLLSAACEMAALSAVTDREKARSFAEYGHHLGLAYQIKDDLFDYLLISKSGKEANNDIKEKKITLPLIHAMKAARGNDKTLISDYLKNGVPAQERIENIIRIAEATGGIEYSKKLVESNISSSLRILDRFRDGNSLKSLRQLTEFIFEREK